MKELHSFRRLLKDNELNYLCCIYLRVKDILEVTSVSSYKKVLTEAMDHEAELYGDLEFKWEVNIDKVQSKVKRLKVSELTDLIDSLSKFEDKIYIVTKRTVVETKEIYRTNEIIKFSESLKFDEILDKQSKCELNEFTIPDEIAISLLNVTVNAKKPILMKEQRKNIIFLPLEVWQKEDNNSKNL